MRMKYTVKTPPIVCMQTHSVCYRRTGRMKAMGVLWHSTGANNPYLWRYVQPFEGDENAEALLRLLGVNRYRSDWNHQEVEAGLNAWIGKLSDGTVAAVQTMPWDYMPWGCGGGARGSCNNGWIQFEICEDGLDDPDYFAQVYREGVELTAYLCRLHGLDPGGSVRFNGISVPVLLCHQDSYRLGLGSNHGDIYHWFSRYGKTMEDVRRDVKTVLEEDAMTGKDILEKLTDAEAYALMEKAQRHADTLPLPETWDAAGELAEATAAGITDGTRPMALTTRLEAAVMVKRAMKNNLDVEVDLK